MQQRVAAGVLSAGHARAILSLDDPREMQKLADKIVNEDLSVRAARGRRQDAGVAPVRQKPKGRSRRSGLDDIAERLGDRFDTK